MKQASFIKAYDTLMNQLSADEAVIFVDAVHPTHAVRPVGCCWAPKPCRSRWNRAAGGDRLNIYGAVDLETGQTIMKDVLTVCLEHNPAADGDRSDVSAMRWVHVFVDNARYHHAKLVQAWLAQPGRRIKLHFIPAYCPHLNPIERLWG